MTTPAPIQTPVTDGRRIATQPWIKWFSQLGTRFDNVIVVKTANDLKNIDSSKTYIIDGTVDMRDQSIIVPEGGLSMAGLNGSRDVSILYSSADNYTMFISPDGGYSGDVVMETMTVEVIGTNSKVYDLDNDGNFNALDIVEVNYVDCTSLGELSNYRQLLMATCGFIRGEDGLTFNGDWAGGAAIVDSIAISFPANTTLFKEGTSLLMDNVRSEINFRLVEPTSVLFDFKDANITSDGGFSLNNVRTTADDAVPNINPKLVTSRIRNCLGITNTYVGSEWELTTEIATTIAAANTFYKLAGTVTEKDNQWFDQPTDNQCRMISSQTIDVQVACRFSLSGSNNRQVRIGVFRYDDGTATFEEVGKSPLITLNSAGRAENIAFDEFTEMEENDYIEIRVENVTDATNVTLLENSKVLITERPS